MKNDITATFDPELHPKGWGYEKWLVNNEKYCGKILHFNTGKKCSFHYHKIKHEHFYVLKGCFKVVVSENDNIEDAITILLQQGEVYEIPTGLRHQMIALEDSDIIEISTHHLEEDSYRIVKGD